MHPTELQQNLSFAGIDTWLAFMGIETWLLRNKPSGSYMPRTEVSVSISETRQVQPSRIKPETDSLETCSLTAPPLTVATLEAIPLEAVTSWQFGFVIRHRVLWCFESLTKESEQRLAQAIMGALTRDYSTVNFAYHQWPLLDDEPLSAATARLQAFMNALKGQVTHIVSVGSLNQQVFLPLLSSDWPGQQATLIELPALQQMLEDASCKRTAWETLKSHAQALTAKH